MNITDHIYSEHHRVHTHHCDPHLSARLPYFFQIVQEGAATHAMLSGCSNPDFEKIGKAWVLSKIHINVSSYPVWSDEITLETWIQPTRRFYAPREARAVDARGNVLFRTMAYWVIINIETRRPERPDQFLDMIGLSQDRSRWTDTTLGKVPRLDPDTEDTCFTPQIQYRDIDSVGHVNNISYLEWMLESMEPSYQEDFLPCEFEINFTAESFKDTNLVASSKENTPGNRLHVISKQTPSGPLETCRARSIWKPRSELA